MAKVIARYRNPGPKYVYVVYRVDDPCYLKRVGTHTSERDAKKLARTLADEFQGREYVVIREER